MAKPRLVKDIIQDMIGQVEWLTISLAGKMNTEEETTLDHLENQLIFLRNHFDTIRDEFLKTIAECTPQEGGNIEHDSGPSGSPEGD